MFLKNVHSTSLIPRHPPGLHFNPPEISGCLGNVYFNHVLFETGRENWGNNPAVGCMKEMGVVKRSGRNCRFAGRNRTVFNPLLTGKVILFYLRLLLAWGSEQPWTYPECFDDIPGNKETNKSWHEEIKEMPMRNIPDSSGHTMKLYVHEKKPWYLSPPGFYNYDMVENMPEYPLRDDDIIICSYMKSGCHWTWEIVSQLVKGRAVPSKVDKESAMMEAHELFADIEKLSSPRILNNHQFFENQPADVLKKKIKIVFVYRNPKDVVVSHYFHTKRLPYSYTGDFNSYLVRYAEGLVDNNSIFDYLNDWENAIQDHPDINLCLLSYEDLQADPLPHLKRLSAFLEKDYDDKFLQAVVTACSFDSLKQHKSDLLPMLVDKDGNVMYRKGKVGDWKNYFTVAQSEWFDHVIRTRMRGSKLFKFRYALEGDCSASDGNYTSVE